MNEYIRYLNLPKIPSSLLEDFKTNSQLCPHMTSPFFKTGEHCDEITKWCQQNISADSFYGVQIMDANVSPHKDQANYAGIPESKLVYLVDPGGDSVKTVFWDNNEKFLKYYVIKPFRWHLIQVNVLHSVSGIEPGNKRWAVTTQIFHQENNE